MTTTFGFLFNEPVFFQRSLQVIPGPPKVFRTGTFGNYWYCSSCCPNVGVQALKEIEAGRARWRSLMHVVDKCIIQLVDRQAFSKSAEGRRFQCVDVCLRGLSVCLLLAVYSIVAVLTA